MPEPSQLQLQWLRCKHIGITAEASTTTGDVVGGEGGMICSQELHQNDICS